MLPIADRQLAYARQVAARLAGEDLRVEVDERKEKIGYKIRAAQLEKVPFMLVVGEWEEAAGTVAVRHRQKGDLGPISLSQFLASLRQETGPPVGGG